MLEKWKQTLKGRKILIDILEIAFGLGAWLLIHGLWVELQLLVEALPEGWSLPSYLSVMVQIANTGPLTFGLLNRIAPNIVTTKRGIWVTLSLAVTSAILLPIFWNNTAEVFGRQHSVALLVLCFTISLSSCTSTVLHLPYVGLFGGIYLPSYLLGDGFSSLLSSVLAIIQGVGQSECVNSGDPNKPGLVEIKQPPRFSTEVYFSIIAIIIVISALAFPGLEFLPSCKKERASERQKEIIRATNDSPVAAKYGTRALWFLLCTQFWLSFMQHGILISIHTYSCIPYGNTVYYWSTILVNIAHPLACLVAFYKPCMSLSGIGGLVAVGSAVSAYLLWTAATSPTPPLFGASAGAPIIVTAWFLYSSLTMYARISIACVLRENTWTIQNVESSSGRSATESRLFKYGLFTQAGSFIGSVIMFVLVNVVVIFTAAKPCSL